MSDGDELIIDHPYQGELRAGASCQYKYREISGWKHPADQQDGFDEYEYKETICARQAMEHANPGPTHERHLIHTHPHDFTPMPNDPAWCGYSVVREVGSASVCGYSRMSHEDEDRARREAAKKNVSALVRAADIAQYERAPMPDAARLGPVVTLIDAPVDPLGTLAVIGGIYSGRIARSKAEATEEQRRAMLADMQATVLDGPLESIQFTFLIEGVSRAFTHQAVRNRFSFFAQESLRFAVAEDWAQEVPLPSSLSAVREPEGRNLDTAGEWIPKGNDEVAVGIWRKALNAAEDAYNALVGAGMPAEEARGVLPHAITTRYYWTVSLRTLLQEAGKRTCTQAQFDWRIVMAGVAKALRERARYGWDNQDGLPYIAPDEHGPGGGNRDGWQYRAFADLIRPVCYQQGKCGFMAKFDRGCTIRARVDAFERAGVPSSEWDVDRTDSTLASIHPSEWAADPGAARVKGEQ